MAIWTDEFCKTANIFLFEISKFTVGTLLVKKTTFNVVSD